MLKYLLFLSFSLAAPVVNANESWNYIDNDTANWELVTYKNQTSGVIGSFNPSTKSLGIVTEGTEQGLLGEEFGFLQYTLSGNANFAQYDQGSINIVLQETAQIKNDVLDMMPAVLFLEGKDQNDNRMLLACSLPAYTNGSIDIINTQFSIVNEFYYEYLGFGGDPSAPSYVLHYNADGFLDEAEFSSFLGSVQSLYIRNYSENGAIGLPVGGLGQDYTYLQSLNIATNPIPEPTTGLLGLASLTGVLLRRKRA